MVGGGLGKVKRNLHVKNNSIKTPILFIWEKAMGPKPTFVHKVMTLYEQHMVENAECRIKA
jgi:hypothetical protein